MKPLFLLFLFFCLVQCNDVSTTKTEIAESITNLSVIANVEVPKSDLVLNQLEGVWYYQQKPFNGYSIKNYPNGNVEEKLGFFNGKREGIAKRWSENGVLRVVSNYNQNKLEGTYSTWWENGVVAEESTYLNGELQGVQKQWYDNGQLAKQRNLKFGKEQGMQKAWLKNGTLYVNYEARNGRVFGLMRSNLCYQLENEVVIKDSVETR